jgi:hypothetical protein
MIIRTGAPEKLHPFPIHMGDVSILEPVAPLPSPNPDDDKRKEQLPFTPIVNSGVVYKPLPYPTAPDIVLH